MAGSGVRVFPNGPYCSKLDEIQDRGVHKKRLLRGSVSIGLGANQCIETSLMIARDTPCLSASAPAPEPIANAVGGWETLGIKSIVLG